MARLRGWGELGAAAGLPARFLSDHVSFDFSPRRPTCQRPAVWGLARRRGGGEIVLVVPPLRHGRRLSRPINQDDHLGSTMSIQTAAKQSGDQDRAACGGRKIGPIPAAQRPASATRVPSGAVPLVRVNHFHVRLVARRKDPPTSQHVRPLPRDERWEEQAGPSTEDARGPICSRLSSDESALAWEVGRAQPGRSSPLIYGGSRAHPIDPPQVDRG